MGVLRKFGSIGGNIVGGYLADKFGTGKLMLLSICCYAGWADCYVSLFQMGAVQVQLS